MTPRVGDPGSVTAAAHRHCLREITPYTSALPNHNNPPKQKPENVNVRTRTGLAMRGGALAFKLVLPSNTVTTNPARRLFCARTHNSFMADAPAKPQPIQAAKKKEEPESVKELPPPPPPEKPEPGDCCGSGCVRCVWDVYYDELEEYNKLYKSDSNSNS